MSFDIDKVLDDMADAIANSAKDGCGDIGAAAGQILDGQREAIRNLADALARDEIDETVFDREIEREKKVLEAELLTLQIMTKALAQRAVNAAIDVLVDAVKAAI